MIRKASCIISLLIFLLVSQMNVHATESKFDYKIEIPTVIEYNRTIEVDMKIDSNNIELAGGVFVLSFDSELINFKGVTFTNKNSERTIDFYEINNTVRVAFLALDSIHTNQFESAFKIEFTPKEVVANTEFSVYFEQAGSIEEEFLDFNNAIVYDIEVSKNETSQTFASGEEVSDVEQEKLKELQEENVKDFEEEQTNSDENLVDNNNIIIEDNSDNSNIVTIFILGIIACCVMFIGVFLMLKYFKDRKTE